MTRADIGAAYDASASAWTGGPATVYGRLAAAMLRRSPVPVAGARVLDVGAGTGVAARAAIARGARRVVATDVAREMLAQREAGIEAAVADAAMLPFADGSFDLVTASCSLGHLTDPAAALREARRVAAVLVATVFAPGETHPVKAAIDEVMEGIGFVQPDWYSDLKRDLEPQVEDADGLAALAIGAGYASVAVDVDHVDVGLETAEQVADWRLGMAHLAPFLATLSDEGRRAARAAAVAAADGDPPVVLTVLVLSAS
jgi:SAM-dependent methyltransferase